MSFAREYSSAAPSSSNQNWLNNGGFVDYPSGLALLEDFSVDRQGAPSDASNSDIDGLRTFDLIDKKKYGRLNYSFVAAKEAGSENILGYWDIYGSDASVEIAPLDSGGSVITSFDGGNLVRVGFPSAGTTTFSQSIEDVKPFRGQEASFGISGRSFSKNATIKVALYVDGEELISKSAQSKTFGNRRRITSSVKIGDNAKEIEFRVEVTGSSGSSVGLSGAALVLGPAGPAVPYTPSIVDLVIPSGTVILIEGDTCPAGYREAISSQDSMVLMTAGQASFQGGDLVYSEGSDVHDHNPNGALDGFSGSPSGSPHSSGSAIPAPEQAAVHGIPFGFSLGLSGGDSFPSAKPLKVLGATHSHFLSSSMTAIPPTFPLRICSKL